VIDYDAVHAERPTRLNAAACTSYWTEREAVRASGSSWVELDDRHVVRRHTTGLLMSNAVSHRDASPTDRLVTLPSTAAGPHVVRPGSRPAVRVDAWAAVYCRRRITLPVHNEPDWSLRPAVANHFHALLLFRQFRLTQTRNRRGDNNRPPDDFFIVLHWEQSPHADRLENR